MASRSQLALQELIRRGSLPQGATIEDARAKLSQMQSGNSTNPYPQSSNPLQMPQEAESTRTLPVQIADNTVDALGSLYSGANRISGDILGGLANTGRDIGNIPHSFLSMFSPELANKTFEPNRTDYAQEAFGITDPNMGDNLVQGAAGFAPFMYAGGAAFAPTVEQTLAKTFAKTPLRDAMLKQGRIGFAKGVTEEDPAKSGMVNSIVNAAFPLGGKIIESVASKAGELGKRLTAPAIVKKIEDSLASKNNKEAFDVAKGNYGALEQVESKAWQKATDAAKQADIDKLKFNNRPYQKALEGKLNELESQSAKQKGFALENKEAEQFLQEQLLSSQTNFSNAFEHNKSLNTYLKKAMGPEMKAPADIINFAKAELKKTIEANLKKHGLESSLGSAWKQANQATSLKKRIFEQLPANKSAKPGRSTFGNFVNNEQMGADVTSFVKDYLPRSGEQDISRMAQFAKMIGDKEEAGKIIGKNYFESAFENGEMNPKAFFSKYGDLSERQRQFIFSKGASQAIEALNKAYKKDPRLLKDSGLVPQVTRTLLDEFGLLDKFRTPAAQQRFINNSLNPQPGKYAAKAAATGKGAQAVASPAISSLTTSLMNYLSGGS